MPAQTVIKFRRDTSANWASANPVLASGEAGYDTTEKKLKIGDGTTAWSGLDFASGSASVVVAETAPTGAEEGNVWYNSTEGTSYIYYDATWVPLSPAIVGPEGPQGPIGETGPTGPQGEPGVGVPTIDSTTTGEMLVSNGTTSAWSNTVTANSALVTAINVVGTSGQSAPIQAWSINGVEGIGSVGPNGFIFSSPADNVSPVLINARSGQTADLQRWRNSGGTTLASISSTGLLTATPAEPTPTKSASNVGYVGMPQNATNSGNYTIVAADAGKHLYSTATRTVTIPANSSVAFEIGTTIVFISGSGATTTIAINSDVLQLVGATSATPAGTSRTLAPFGMATAVKVAQIPGGAATWYISGNGLT